METGISIRAILPLSLQNPNNSEFYLKECMMAWKELFTTDVGLGSLAVIVFVIGMSIFFGRMFNKKMNEKPTDE